MKPPRRSGRRRFVDLQQVPERLRRVELTCVLHLQVQDPAREFGLQVLGQVVGPIRLRKASEAMQVRRLAGHLPGLDHERLPHLLAGLHRALPFVCLQTRHHLLTSLGLFVQENHLLNRAVQRRVAHEVSKANPFMASNHRPKKILRRPSEGIKQDRMRPRAMCRKKKTCRRQGADHVLKMLKKVAARIRLRGRFDKARCWSPSRRSAAHEGINDGDGHRAVLRGRIKQPFCRKLFMSQRI